MIRYKHERRRGPCGGFWMIMGRSPKEVRIASILMVRFLVSIPVVFASLALGIAQDRGRADAADLSRRWCTRMVPLI